MRHHTAHVLAIWFFSSVLSFMDAAMAAQFRRKSFLVPLYFSWRF